MKNNKQIAKEDDKVMGFDVHIMVVPSGPSTTTVPLPHPFIGKLKDDLSKDVKIKDKKCATKDSVAKHDDSMHMQLPGTIQFQNNPKKDVTLLLVKLFEIFHNSIWKLKIHLSFFPTWMELFFMTTNQFQIIQSR